MLSAVCLPDLSIHIRKALETILDGSEEGVLNFCADGLFIQSVDSLNVCIIQFNFKREKFFQYTLQFRLRVKIRQLYTQLKHMTGYVRFALVDNQLYLNEYTGTEVSGTGWHIPASSDQTSYFMLDSTQFAAQPSFEIRPTDFNNMIMDLAVGGGYLTVAMTAETVTWTTRFETGVIRIVTHSSAKFTLVTPPATPFENVYLTKFFKQACSITTMCDSLQVYMAPGSPITLRFSFLDSMEVLLVTTPRIASAGSSASSNT